MKGFFSNSELDEYKKKWLEYMSNALPHERVPFTQFLFTQTASIIREPADKRGLGQYIKDCIDGNEDTLDVEFEEVTPLQLTANSQQLEAKKPKSK
ncbi:MAG: hypothetical protein ABJG41_01475 [Cyclobacteriaceae bacterium]